MKNNHDLKSNLIVALAIVCLSGCASIKRQYANILESEEERLTPIVAEPSSQKNDADTNSRTKVQSTAQTSIKSKTLVTPETTLFTASDELHAQTADSRAIVEQKKTAGPKSAQDTIVIPASVNSGKMPADPVTTKTAIVNQTVEVNPVSGQQKTKTKKNVAPRVAQPQVTVKSTATPSQNQPKTVAQTPERKLQKRQKPEPNNPVEQKPAVIKAQTVQLASAAEIEREESAQSIAEQSIAGIKKLNQTQPTAAGTPVTEVLKNAPQLVDSISAIEAADTKTQDFGMWQIEPQCRITSPTMEVYQNDYATQFWLDVIDNELIVNSSTNINIKKKGVGVRFNEGELIAFSANRYSNGAKLKGNIGQWLLASNELHIYLGGDEFKGNQSVTIPLAELKRAYRKLKTCR